MTKTQIVKMLLRVAKEDLKNNDIVNVSDISELLEYKCGKVRWSNREIAASLSKIRDVYIPTDIDKKSGLRQYQICNTS